MLNLDHDRPAARKRGAMHLRDRCGCQWHIIKCLKHVIDFPSQFFFDGGANGFWFVGWYICLQLRQLDCQWQPDQIGTRAQDLTEFDERGAQFGERQADARLPSDVSEPVAFGPTEQPVTEPDI